MPDLASVEAATVRAYNPAGEHAASAVPTSKLHAALDLHLHQLKNLGTDDGWVAVPDVILRKLALIFLHLLREEVRAEGLLQNRMALPSPLLPFQTIRQPANRFHCPQNCKYCM